MKIKARLAELGKRNIDCIEELHKRGIHATNAEFSWAINKKRLTAKSDEIIAETEKIIKEWEDERHGRSVS